VRRAAPLLVVAGPFSPVSHGSRCRPAPPHGQPPGHSPARQRNADPGALCAPGAGRIRGPSRRYPPPQAPTSRPSCERLPHSCARRPRGFRDDNQSVLNTVHARRYLREPAAQPRPRSPLARGSPRNAFMGAERCQPVEHSIRIPGEKGAQCKLRGEPLRELQHARKARIDMVGAVARDEFAVRLKRVAVIHDALT